MHVYITVTYALPQGRTYVKVARRALHRATNGKKQTVLIASAMRYNINKIDNTRKK